MTRETLLLAKYFISGCIEVKTGLHIGGSKSDLDIGGVDLGVIKTARGLPFIPGSSLKGKLRSLLARKLGSTDVNDDPEEIMEVFGFSTEFKKRREKELEENKAKGGAAPAAGPPLLATRLIVRDAYLDETHFKGHFKREQLDTPYTEVKWENTIDRKTGTAEHPRQLERVPAGARFHFELIYNSFNDGKTAQHLKLLYNAMHMLEEDYLGGQGSRGYGQIAFIETKTEMRSMEDYEAGNARQLVENMDVNKWKR